MSSYYFHSMGQMTASPLTARTDGPAAAPLCSGVMPLILVIEDDPTQRLLTSSVLRKIGYVVVEAADGAQGLALAREQKPDLIVCDVMMPGMNGYELAAAIKQDAALATTPIIMLTAMGNRSHVRIGMTAGADDYISKPFAAVELRDAVAALLARQRRHRSQHEGEVSTAVDAALKDQKNRLSGQYEERLAVELNERWARDGGPAPERSYEHAAVLAVDLFGAILSLDLPAAQQSAAVRRLYQSTHDSLHLFGVRQVVAAGNDLLAVFVDDEEPRGTRPRLQALRAAMGISRAAGPAAGTLPDAVFAGLADAQSRAHAGPPVVSMGLHTGALTLLTVNDPLHGGDGATLFAGAAARGATALRDHARASGWLLAASPAALQGLTAAVVTSGKPVVPATAAGGCAAVRVHALA